MVCAVQVTVKGPHMVHLQLDGQPIAHTPIEFHVHPGAALGTRSKLYPPTEPPIVKEPCLLRLHAIDKYGNHLEEGGARIDARANGPGVTACTSEDLSDGTYTIEFSAAVVGETRVIVRLDNVEMPPLRVLFIESAGEASGKKKKGAGSALEAKAALGAPSAAAAGPPQAAPLAAPTAAPSVGPNAAPNAAPTAAPGALARSASRKMRRGSLPGNSTSSLLMGMAVAASQGPASAALMMGSPPGGQKHRHSKE